MSVRERIRKRIDDFRKRITGEKSYERTYKKTGVSIDLVEEGTIDGYKYAAFEISKGEIDKRLKRARRYLGSVVEDELKYGEAELSKETINAEVENVRDGTKNPWEVFEDHHIEVEYYIPQPREKASELVMEDALQKVEGAPPYASAMEEIGYSLPEYSLYWSADARGYTGRWEWSQGGGVQMCWGFISDEKTCNKLYDKYNKLEREAVKNDRYLLFGVWEER